ncbi:MAG: hypothetical protein IPL82_09800 [Elusimicrobia bacterium]|nr:hypothetical protein [Elusimicrobiota bacterium]
MMLQGTRFGKILETRGGMFGYTMGSGQTSSFVGGRGSLVRVGEPTRAYGKYGQCAVFNGTNQAYTLPSFNVGPGCSFGVRFKHTATTASMTLMDFPQSVGGGAVIYMRANEGGTGKINIAGLSPFFNVASSSSSFNDGLWHSAVGVYGSNSGTMTLFVDGKQEGSVAATVPRFLSDYPRVASERWFGADYSWYNGSLADPFCVQTILTLQDVRLYHTDMGKYGEDNPSLGLPFIRSRPWIYYQQMRRAA